MKGPSKPGKAAYRVHLITPYTLLALQREIKVGRSSDFKGNENPLCCPTISRTDSNMDQGLDSCKGQGEPASGGAPASLSSVTPKNRARLLSGLWVNWVNEN